MNQTYTIRPLEWEDLSSESPYRQHWYAQTPSGPTYSVWKIIHRDGFMWSDGVATKDCGSIADGKAAAEAHYLSRLLPALEPVKETA